MVGAFVKRLKARLEKHWRLGDWNPWRRADGARPVDVSADRLIVTVFSLWLACVPFAVWMAFGQLPGWLAGPFIVALWVFAGLHLLTVGLAPLAIPFFLVWLVFPGNRKKADQWKDPQEEWEDGYDEHVKWAAEMKEQGSLPEDYEIPPKRREDFRAYINEKWPDKPIQRLTIKIAGVILIAALFLSGRPVLAAVYAFPSLGWLALDGFEWIMLRRRGA